jgi:BRCA1-associated protein
MTCRIRKRPVSFGNPALGTYHGTVFTAEDCQDDYISINKPIIPDTIPTQHMVCMVDVPPEQVPEGILNLARSHRPFLDHVRIVIAQDAASDYMIPTERPSIPQFLSSYSSLSNRSISGEESSFLRSTSGVPPSPSASAMESAASIFAADEELESQKLQQQQQRDSKSGTLSKKKHFLDMLDADDTSFSSARPSRTYLVLFELQTEQDADTFVQELHGRPFTSLDETVTCQVHHVLALQGQDGVSVMSPFFAPSTKSTTGGLEILPSTSSVDSQDETGASQHHHHHHHIAEDQNCAVCLEHMVLDTHRRRVDEAANTNTSILTTVCNHTFHLDCLLQWQDSPCPVCRYDHSGLNEALSQCHACGTTEHNYVCLICGAISCVVVNSAAAVATTSGHRSGLDDGSTSCGAVVDNTNSMGPAASHQSQFATSHALQHYDESLHAYALDTETQHVWDFAGQGYVHRLLQNKEDGKLVEVNDPNNTTSQERSLNPGLSDAQEEQVVHRKLEGFASQYYTLLKSQLEQQRSFYEGRLEEIRREYAFKQKQTTPTQDLISALRQERKQLTQRSQLMQRRHEKVSEDVSFLKSMNESLEANKALFQRKIGDAQRQRMDAREMVEKYWPALEEKVTSLMLQLEESNHQEMKCDDADSKPSASGG